MSSAALSIFAGVFDLCVVASTGSMVFGLGEVVRFRRAGNAIRVGCAAIGLAAIAVGVGTWPT